MPMVEEAAMDLMRARAGGSKDKRAKSGQKTGGKSNARHHSKSRSKGKKKGGGGGFGCCRKKEKTPEKTRSKTTKKQPKANVVKPLPPVPNEQLGDIVLVKDKSKIQPPKEGAPAPAPAPPPLPAPPTPEKKMTFTPDKSDPKMKEFQKAINKLDEDEKLKADSREGDEKVEKDKVEKKEVMEKKEDVEKKDILEKKDDVGKKEKKEKKEKVKLDMKESGKESDESLAESKVPKQMETDTPETVKQSGSLENIKKGKHGDKKGSKEKWMKLAKRIVANDASIAANDFDLVSAYMPPHVSKKRFVANMDKNRFCDVVCLDHSRVRLKDDKAYVHASWVDLDKQKKAILTQLPLANTAADFWQMVIEKKVKCILLILTDQEYDTLGGRLVFPPNQDFMGFDDRNIRVGEFRQVELSKGWNLRVLSITNGTYKEFVHVHHYKSWPHNGAPTNIKQVWQIQSAIRRYGNAPPVFMSLSGCGRAGTWALFEVAHLSLHSESSVFEMPKYLERVRAGRLHSVQSLSQFSFVYTLMAEHVLGNGFCRLVKKCVPSEEEEKLHVILKTLTIR